MYKAWGKQLIIKKCNTVIPQFYADVIPMIKKMNKQINYMFNNNYHMNQFIFMAETSLFFNGIYHCKSVK